MLLETFLCYLDEMAAARLDQLRRVRIERAVVERTLVVLRDFGKHHLEGLVLWLGKTDMTHAEVVRAFVPEQHPTSNESGVGYFVSSETLFALNRALTETGLRLIAQVHSHPTDAYH